MPKFERVLVLILLIGLAACTVDRTSAPNPVSPSATATIAPATLIPATGTPTLTPLPPTATDTLVPTPTATERLLPIRNPDLEAEVNQLASAFLKQTHTVGLSIALVVHNPVTDHMDATLLNYGLASEADGRAATFDTVYEVGSITKVFTGILLAEAVNEGKVKLDDPIQAYLPSGVHAPMFGSVPITLDNLATHRASLPRDLDSDNITDLYSFLNTYQLSHVPGSEYAYSNLGYSLLGDILARLYGMDYATLEFQSVSQPLGLLDTRQVLSEEQKSRLAQGYTYDGSPAAYFPDSGAMSGAGYLHSTLADMTRFLIANMQPDPTSLAESIRLAQTMQAEGSGPRTGVGLGWEIEHPGAPTERFWKSGGTSGFTSYISFEEDGSYGFVLLSNGQYVNYLVPGLIRILTENSQ